MNTPADAETIARELATDLRVWTPPDAGQAMLRDEYLEFIAGRGATALDRDGGRSHLTASCFVFTPDLSSVLLCFHRKGQFWVQLGGHIESTDRSVTAAAFREALEEGGIRITPISERPLDVDRHPLGTGFGRCDVHWDLGFGGLAPEGAVPVPSDESEDVRWWPVDALPSNLAAGFRTRLERFVDTVAALP